MRRGGEGDGEEGGLLLFYHFHLHALLYRVLFFWVEVYMYGYG